MESGEIAERVNLPTEDPFFVTIQVADDLRVSGINAVATRFHVQVEDGAAVIDGQKVEVPGLLIVSNLSSGANGVVFEARDDELARATALKVFPVRRHDPRNKLKQGRAEATKVAGLSHPRIVTVYRAGVLPRGPKWFYVEMELLRGEVLKKFLASTPCFNARFCIWRDVVDAVRYSHRRGVYHGDLHSGNVFCEGDGHAKVIDFGTSIFARSAFVSREREASLLTELCAALFPELSMSALTNDDFATLAPESALEACDTAVELIRVICELSDVGKIYPESADDARRIRLFRTLSEEPRLFAIMLAETPTFSLEKLVTWFKAKGASGAICYFLECLKAVCVEMQNGTFDLNDLRTGPNTVTTRDDTEEQTRSLLNTVAPVWTSVRSSFLAKGPREDTVLRRFGSAATRRLLDDERQMILQWIRGTI